MKKNVFVLLIFTFFVSIRVVNASNLSDTEKDLFNRDDITIVERTEKTILTTTVTDVYGNILDVYHDEIEADDDESIEAARVETEERYNLLSSKLRSGPMIYYNTDSKHIALDYYKINGEAANIYHTYTYVAWYTVPVVQSFDVIAIRWTNNATLLDATGKQRSKTGTTYRTTEYSYKGTNMKIASNGVGISMNLHNNGSDYTLELLTTQSATSNGEVYATYQHARNSNLSTLAQSQSYTFSANGLGKVLYYSNATIRGYYDGMKGVSLNYTMNINQ